MEDQRSLTRQSQEIVLPPHIEAALDSELPAALQRDEIEVLFQPQFSCGDGQMVGAEALARWQHPTLGLIGAGKLFAIADRAGQVAALSQTVMARALEIARNWPANLRLSLNITPQELGAPGFADEFVQLVVRSGISPQRLTVEITEDLLVRDVALAATALDALRQAGLKIALDDFGAGFCNFAYLKSLPIDAIKLDRSMVMGVCSDARDRAVLRAMVALADALELDIVAEGIETEGQRDTVIAEGCTYWQGFLNAEPMSSAAMVDLATA